MTTQRPDPTGDRNKSTKHDKKSTLILAAWSEYATTNFQQTSSAHFN